MSTSNLEELRHSIDEIDQQLMSLLAQRFAVTREVGIEKTRSNLHSVDPAREDRILEKWADFASANQMDPDFAKGIIRMIIDRVVEEHNEIREKSEAGQ